MDIVQEPLTRELIDEMECHLQSHWEEVFGSDFHDVDWLLMRSMDDRGMLKTYIARDKEKMVGYMAYIISPDHHKQGRTIAVCDAIYVIPEYRGYMLASRMIGFAEKELKDNGVNVIFQAVPDSNDFSPLLKRKGFKIREHWYLKEIA